MIYDVILIVIVAALVLFNYSRGAAKALAGILTAVASYALATLLGKLLAFRLYEWLVQPSVEKAVGEAVSSLSLGAGGLNTDALPQWLIGLLDLSGTDLSAVSESIFSGAVQPASSAISGAIQPITVSLLTLLATVALFLIFCLLIRLLAVGPILKLFELPVIRTANRIAGGVIGLVDAFLLISMLAYLLRLLQPYLYAKTGAEWLSESTIYNSFIFYHFYSGNIFTAISSLIR